MKKKRVAVAISGGVDSGVTAALLVKKGYDCAGFHLHLWSESKKEGNKCCSTESLEAARKTCHQLGIPFYILDFSQIFKKKVVDYFLKAYGDGLTPNPCIYCNKFIKFGELYDYVRKLGYDYLATGHYAQIMDGGLFAAKDKKKDQTYFLFNLTQKKLEHILFPVGDLDKAEVRKIAQKLRLPVAERPESQEVCFFPENDYRPFLHRRIPAKIIPGKVVNKKGELTGEHRGLPLYTYGQRHGFAARGLGPWYVVDKRIKGNQLIVGFGKETERKEFKVKSLNIINPHIVVSLNRHIAVRIRHQGELMRAKILRDKDTKILRVILVEPVRGIAPGQAAVFYARDEVLGGGVIY